MTKRLYKNAIWPVDGSLCDYLADGSSSLINLDGNKLPIEGKLCPAGELEAEEGTQVIDATGKYILPALVDLHATICQKGKSASTAVKLASDAARKGGVGTLLVMPSPRMRLDNHATLDSFREAVAEYSQVRMLPAGCLSIKGEGEQQAPYNTLATRGVRMLSDAPNAPHNLLMLYRAMNYVAELDMTLCIRGDVPALSAQCCAHPSATSYELGLRAAPACTEAIGIETITKLAEETGVRLHIQSISTAKGLKSSDTFTPFELGLGADSPISLGHSNCFVSTEVHWHHLMFSHEDIGDFDTTFKTQPPLRDVADCAALIEGLKSAEIDCIVSDHRAVPPFDKKQDFPSAPQGMLGLDTYLQALYTHLIKTGKLDWYTLVRSCCMRPAELLYGEGNIPAQPCILFDPEYSECISAASLPSGTLNSPFMGQTLYGKVESP